MFLTSLKVTSIILLQPLCFAREADDKAYNCAPLIETHCGIPNSFKDYLTFKTSHRGMSLNSCNAVIYLIIKSYAPIVW